ncbi:MAG: response regulator transcription factor [Anaerolineaceae bacterium]
MTRILWIEGKRAESSSFIPGLRKKGYDIEIVATGAEALKRLSIIDPDLVILNAASLHSTGKRICRSLREMMNGIPIVLIASDDNPPPEDVCANVVLTLPFTERKLHNRIKPLIAGDGNNVLRVGPIRLDMERRRVRCQGREARLTPRLAQILQIFMRQPGVVIERNVLFREAWSTDYTGDTRSLDTHINWLRQAIEEDPRNPKFIKTLRGVGYRLDI